MTKKDDKAGDKSGRPEKVLGTGAAGDPYNPEAGAPLGGAGAVGGGFDAAGNEALGAPEDVETSTKAEVTKSEDKK